MLATATEMFTLDEWQNPLLSELTNGHQWIVADCDKNGIIGAAYFGPEQVSNSLWNIYFLAVSPSQHGKGIGRTIMTHIEERALAENINTLLVETSSLEKYSQARGFYLSMGYVKEAVIRDYYGPKENKIVYWKSLS